MTSTTKSNKDVLEQTYMTARDLQILIPNLGYTKALSYIEDVRKEMVEKGYFVPKGKTKVALTKIIKKNYGI